MKKTPIPVIILLLITVAAFASDNPCSKYGLKQPSPARGAGTVLPNVENLCTNGTFAVDASGWTLTAPATASGEQVYIGGLGIATYDMGCDVGDTVEIVLQFSDISAGFASTKLGTTAIAGVGTSNGVFRNRVEAAGSCVLSVSGSLAFNGYIDNVEGHFVPTNNVESDRTDIEGRPIRADRPVDMGACQSHGFRVLTDGSQLYAR